MSQPLAKWLLLFPLTTLCACRSPFQAPTYSTDISQLAPASKSNESPATVPTDEPANEPSVKATTAPVPDRKAIRLDVPATATQPVTLAAHTIPSAPPVYSCGCQHGDDEGPIFRSCESGCEDGQCEWPADEYLCDGGDQETQVSMNRQRELRGLDPEDTVAHYDTTDGRTLIHPSNSVCIYAPRFAAVRKVVTVSEDERLLTMESLDQPQPPFTDFAPQPPKQIEQPLPPLQMAGLRGALALRERTGGMELLQAQRVMELAEDYAAYEDFQIVRLGIHQRSQRALVEEHAEAALAWTDYLAPEVMLLDEPAEVDTTVEKPSTIHHLDERGTPKIRVLKLASAKTARPGEEVEFTLRFDNVGDQPISQVTLVDRLTTRLEYVPDSAQSSLKAKFSTAPHETDSLVLRWEIEESIKPGEGGILRFRCKVR